MSSSIARMQRNVPSDLKADVRYMYILNEKAAEGVWPNFMLAFCHRKQIP